jgi:hypothetical protein
MAKTAARIRWEEANREQMTAYQREYSRKHKDKIAANGAEWHAKNRERQLLRARENYRKNKADRLAKAKAYRESHPEMYREAHRKRTYGLSPEQQRAVISACNARCAICGGTGTKRGLFFDHDHSTGKVRGVLCEACNTAIGRMKDDPLRLRAAADYVERGGVL